MLDGFVERCIAELTAADDGGSLDRAREAFDRQTGTFEVGDRCYEERISFFFEHFLCDRGGARRWLDDHPDASHEERRAVRAMSTSARSVYSVVAAERGEITLDDRLGGGRFVLAARGPAERLAPGEIFDGRLVVLDDIVLMSGIIFHPPEAHDALEALLEAITPLDGEREPILDGLLRMRMRLERFTSIRARHIYRAEALDDPNILSAGWARKSP